MKPQRLFGSFLNFTAFILAATLLSSCGFSSSPSTAVRAFFSAIDKGNHDKALHCFEPAIAEEGGKVRMLIDGVIKMTREKGGIIKVEIISETERQDGKVKVDYRLHFRNQSSDTDSILTVKIKGRWYLTLE